MTKKFFRIFAVLAALFLVVRVIFYRQLSGTILFDIPILDSEFYYHWARSLAAGQGNPPGPFWLSPLYPYFMAGLFSVLGVSTKIVVMVQFLLSLGTLAFMVFFTRKLFGNAAALATATLAVFYAPWLYYDGVLLSASLILFLNTVILYLLVTWTNVAGENRDPSPSQTQVLDDKWRGSLIWIGIGVLTGLSALARPSILLFAMLMVIWQLRGSRISRRKFQVSKLVRPALFVAAILVVLSPALVRNWAVAQSPILTTSSGGINFFIGNRAGATGIYDEFDFIQSFDPWREAEGFRVEASKRAGKELSIAQASRYWMGQALRDIAVYPLDWLVLMVKKVWLTVQREEIANNLSFRGVAGFTPILGSLPLRWALLFPLAAAGMFLIVKRKHAARTLLLLYVGAYALTNVIFFSSSEYRFPMILVLLPAAGYFLASLWKLLEEKHVRELLLVCGIYLLALVVVNVPSRQVSRSVKPRSDYYNLATVAVDNDQIAESIPLYARSLAVDPEYREARLGLAQSLWRLGNFDDARREFQAAGVNPPDTLLGQPLDTFLEQISFFTEDNNYQGALDYLDRAFPSDGNAPPEIWRTRARIENNLGLYDRAIASLLKGAQEEPDDPEWYYRAGLLAAEHGDSARAEDFQKQAVQRYAAYAPARIELGFRAVHDGDLPTAREQLSELRRIRIPDDSTRHKVDFLSASVDSLERTLGNNQNN
jgi:tetratricopeptide (TPR) repeat protein